MAGVNVAADGQNGGQAALRPSAKALVFDTFGTVVDWRIVGRARGGGAREAQRA